MPNTCASCRHYRPHKRTAGRKPAGMCRRLPPSVTVSRDETGPGGKRDHVARWPRVLGSEEGCGEWEEKT